jgi:hypothetical protein
MLPRAYGVCSLSFFVGFFGALWLPLQGRRRAARVLHIPPCSPTPRTPVSSLLPLFMPQAGAHLSKEFFELVKAIGESKSKQASRWRRATGCNVAGACPRGKGVSLLSPPRTGTPIHQGAWSRERAWLLC